ncbi:Probable protein S-acyltransferase 23 (Probable palmitoyltransferase At2g14255) (Zinc finger DHHC domain-containing protein At2g14255) [Durusdinium trenchii]
MAACLPDSRLVQPLQMHGVPVDARDAFQPTSLMLAIKHDDISTVRDLLKAKANVKAQDGFGTTPLATAIQLGHHYSMFLLLEYGALCTLQTADHQGIRPLHIAASVGDLLVVKLLVKFHGNPVTKDHSGRSALDFAALSGHTDVLDFLINVLQDGDEDGDSDGHRHRLAGKRSVSSCQDMMQVSLDWLIHQVMYPDPLTRKAVPIFCHVACACAVWEHWLTSRPFRWLQMPKITTCFECLLPVVLGFAQCIIRMDPGVIQKQKDSGIKELISMLEKGVLRESLPKTRQLCTSTWVLKGLRTKYCRQTGTCIEEFDHFCILLDVPIGRGNHRPFLLLMFLEVVAQLSHSMLCICTLILEAPPAGIRGVVTNCTQHPMVACLFALHCATIPGIMFLILVQAALISQNLTMNEIMHMRRYEHFWSADQRFTNPFSKGSVVRNCLDFWWTRTRGRPRLGEPLTSL